MNFDLVSDLHIDHWGRSYETDWIYDQSSDIVVVAGDVSDSIDQTCEYLEKLTRYYSRVMVVDGNHEHQTSMEFLEESVKNGVRFIGVCGWWSFDFGIPNVTREQTISKGKSDHGLTDIMIANQLNQSVIEANNLCTMMTEATLDTNVKHIVVVTHSLPHTSCISWNRYPPDLDMVGCYGNSRYQWTLDADINEKCRYWVFGHNHDRKDIPYKHMRFVSNPRGRREDWNRTSYLARTVEVPF
ncbi:MAG: hypothetical protein EBX70_11615 [Betaproteobacteria bacterium]|nr:hypothetical protein [Betaproteobacteria bacterium]